MKRSTTLTISPISKRASLSATLLALLALILWVTPALAAAPAVGVVYEGKSVPGAALGSTRAKVELVYGEPAACNLGSINRTYTCTYKAANGGAITVSYVRNLSFPTVMRNDPVSGIRWSQELAGWRTTAGVTTKLAALDPKAVVAAYPKAIVKYNAKGEIVQVRDAHLGIQVDWLAPSPAGSNLRRVSMAIFPVATITTP